MIAADLAGLAVPLDRLDLLPGNPNQGDVDAVARSYATFGQRKPVVARRVGARGVVIAGNTQLKAAQQLGWPSLAVVWVDDDVETAAAFALADNRTAELGSTDTAALAAMWGSIEDAQLLAATGWSDEAISELLASLQPTVLPPALSDPDAAPELPVEPVSVVGDVWQMGPHRLVVGDSTDVGVWDKLLQGELADMVWTDPPYGVSYVGKTSDALTIENDTLDENGLGDFVRAAFGAVLVATRPGACWYVTTPPGPLHLVFGNALHDLGVLRQTLVWVKDQFVMGRSDYHYRHEPIYYGWSPGAAHHPVPDRTQDSVHECPRPKTSKEHPTMKPAALIARHIENSTDTGQLVVDPFGGSGSTLIACHGTGRRAALIELDRKYADVICRRYQEHTGTVPTRDDVPHDFTAL